MIDEIAARLAESPALEVEDWLRETFARRRESDAVAGGAAFGAHRSDMRMEDAATGLTAGLASTGQQKALLIGTVLGHAALIARSRGVPPLLLLDEPAVHLDLARRNALWAALCGIGGQAFLTGTDREPFQGLEHRAEFLQAGEGRLNPAEAGD